MLVFLDVGLSPYAIDTNLIENIISEIFIPIILDSAYDSFVFSSFPDIK